MLPPQFKGLFELLRSAFEPLQSDLNKIKEATEKQEAATTNASQTAEEQMGKIPGIITPVIEASHLDLVTHINSQQQKNKAQRRLEYIFQRKMLRVSLATAAFTGLAFAAAGIYACIANDQLDKMKWQTFYNCLNTQATQQTLLQVVRSAGDAHAAAAATVEQANAEIQSQRAHITFMPRFPTENEVAIMNGKLQIPYAVRNDGKSALLSMKFDLKATFVRGNDVFRIKEDGEYPEFAKYLPAGAEAPDVPPHSTSRPLTIFVGVKDIKGKDVILASPEAQDFLHDGPERVMVFGHVKYIDLFGVQDSRFCYPIFEVRAGTRFEFTKNEKENDTYCGNYNEDAPSAAMVKVDVLLPIDTSKIQPIVCQKPIE